MYALLLPAHSLFRWFVLVSLLVSIIMAFHGWKTNKTFGKLDNSIRHWTATFAHIQLLLGLSLYFISPLITYFLCDFPETIHQREFRFFGMEHSLMMLIGIVVVTIGSAKAKRKPTHAEKFRTIAIWYSIGLLIILSSVPWPFSPFTARPYIRPF
ncbi:hypothetical protein [Jiulongibacter sp. NS-SX5]|uniref:hypothetical protein n=1 Tax=Jiulongibacter sp. NS-SX5 TaxID=3463854 RepID=UPI004059FBC2